MHQNKAPPQSFLMMHVFAESGTKYQLDYEQLKHIVSSDTYNAKQTKCHAYIVYNSTLLTFSTFRSKIVIYFRVPFHHVFRRLLLFYLFNVKSALAYDILIVCFKTSR
jgi:hypothetical protein